MTDTADLEQRLRAWAGTSDTTICEDLREAVLLNIANAAAFTRSDGPPPSPQVRNDVLVGEEGE